MGRHRRIPEEQRVAFNQQVLREAYDKEQHIREEQSKIIQEVLVQRDAVLSDVVEGTQNTITGHMVIYERTLRAMNNKYLQVLSECELQKMVRQELLDTFSVEVQKELRKVGA